MFGEKAGYISSKAEDSSEKRNAQVDQEVKKILDVIIKILFKIYFQDSAKRVTALLMKKEKELRELSKNLFHYDYLTAEEMEKIIIGKKLDKEKVRNWENKEQYLIKF